MQAARNWVGVFPTVIESYGEQKSLGVQWLGRQASTPRGMGSVPGQGPKILRAMQYSQGNAY